MPSKTKLHVFFEWLKARIREPSSRIALITLASLLGIKLTPEYQELIIQGGLLVASFVAFITGDPQSIESKEGHERNVEQIEEVTDFATESVEELHARIDELQAELKKVDLLGEDSK